MSKTNSIQLKNKDKVSVYQTKNGVITTEKTSTPLNENNKKNMRTISLRNEFAEAVHATTQFRGRFKSAAQQIKDGTVHQRLVASFRKLLQKDTVHERGERMVEYGDLTMIQGFEFNDKSKFGINFNAPYEVAVNRVDGLASISIPSFVPQEELKEHTNATHFKLIASVAAFNFETGENAGLVLNSAKFPISTDPTTDINFDLPFTPNESRHLFISLGIVFTEVLDARDYALYGGEHNALRIIKVLPKV
ncbi:hypothetical protein LX64_05030 [Chitinophaga skermanii]|uniref:Uncharacterized protein n=1 Tax=Chitinophaga skermanii TaxID=331697 RepID=A0A327Q7H6_9BACT|nr:hypothetical protein [Chitinophaga skermanii]RAI97726.1 hypothetical protein LX64_05030 [Chitinophaga skermanii]